MDRRDQVSDECTHDEYPLCDPHGWAEPCTNGDTIRPYEKVTCGIMDRAQLSYYVKCWHQ